MISSFLIISLRNVFIILITLLIFRIISSRLSIAEFGEINYVLTAIEIALLFAGLGAPEVARRKIAQESSSRGMGGHFSIYLKSIALCAPFVAVGIYLLIAEKTARSGQFMYFLVISLLLFFTGVKKYFISVYESLEKYLTLSLLLLFESIAILVFVFFLKDLNASKVFIAYLMPLVFVSGVLWKNTEMQPGSISLKEYVIDGKKLFSLGVSIFLFHKIDIFLLERLASGRELGLYAGMYRIYEASYILPGIISVIIYPRLFDNGASNTSLFKDSLLINISFSLVFMAAVIFFSHHIIGMTLTEKFIPGKNILQVLTLGMILQAVSMILGRGIIALQDEKSLLKIALGGIVINVVLNLYLIPAYGALGAAFSTVVSFTFSMLAQLYYYVSHKAQRYLNLNMPAFLSVSFFCFLALVTIFRIYMME